MGRAHRANLLAAAGYVVGVAVLVWGLLSGDLLTILVGLVVVAIVLVTSE